MITAKPTSIALKEDDYIATVPVLNSIATDSSIFCASPDPKTDTYVFTVILANVEGQFDVFKRCYGTYSNGEPCYGKVAFAVYDFNHAKEDFKRYAIHR